MAGFTRERNYCFFVCLSVNVWFPTCTYKVGVFSRVEINKNSLSLDTFYLLTVSKILIDPQLMVDWETDSSNTEVLDFTAIPYTIIASYSHLNYPWLNFGNGILFWCNYFVFLTIKLGFLFKRSSIPTVVTIMSDEDKSWGQRVALTGDWTPVSQSIAMSYNGLHMHLPVTKWNRFFIMFSSLFSFLFKDSNVFWIFVCLWN